MREDTRVDSSNCETMPLRFPGAVQPHGALLVLEAGTGLIEAASESCHTLLGLSPESMLGRSLESVLGAAVARPLLGDPCEGLRALVPLAVQGAALNARRSVNEARQILIDIERAGGDLPLAPDATYHRRRVLAELRRGCGIAVIAQEAVALVRAMTGFDRVMLHRFDEAWNGEIIGEACVPGIEPYLGLHYPASDIPRQARELFQTSHVRHIPDVNYVPSALVMRGAEMSVDLGSSSLRSVSPTHIEYLRNMGVRATLVGYLIVEGRLWGLMSCQHRGGAMHVVPSVRDTFEWLCDDIAALLEGSLLKQRLERVNGLAMRRRRLVDMLRKVDLKELLTRADGTDLLEVVGADGFAVISGDSIQVMGNVPTLETIRLLQRRGHDSQGGQTPHSSSPSVRDLGVSDATGGIVRALFVSLHNGLEVTMIWFRSERHFVVRWGGDPFHALAVDEAGRVSPRKSFAQFAQDVHEQPAAWTPEELASAAELGSLIDIEALKASEALLEYERTQLRTLLQTIPDMVWLKDLRGVYLTCNPAYQHLLGAAEQNIVGKTDYDLMAVSQADLIREHELEAAVSIVPRRNERWVIHGEGNRVLLEVTKTPMYDANGCLVGVISIGRDITQRRRIEEELERHRHHLEALVEERTAALGAAHADAEAEHRANAEQLRLVHESKMRSSKLEAVGTLAAGIAHDFNNILASIVGYAEMSMDNLPEDSDARRNLAQILSGSFRARDLVARMLTFARESTAERVAVDLIAVTREALALLRASIRPAVELSFENRMTEDSRAVLADPIQIMQIVMNLCINGAAAIENHGLISVCIGPGSALEGVPQEFADGICLTVTDTGTGMSADVLERLFDPFFTTKAPGEGSGLGLSVVYGIVTTLGGVIKVRSSVVLGDTGSEFQVFLPLAA